MGIAKIWFDGRQMALPDDFAHKGDNLRAFFGVPKSKHLWHESDSGDDMLIDPEKMYLIRDRDKFYSASKKINQA